MDQVVRGDAGLTGNMAGFFSSKELPVHQGEIVTTGAAFRETEEMIEGWSADGYLGVELEASALFSLGNYLDLKTSMALLVTDSPIRKEISNVLRGKERETFVNGIVDFVNSPALLQS
jgi:purine-nucleoside phosphorylase